MRSSRLRSRVLTRPSLRTWLLAGLVGLAAPPVLAAGVAAADLGAGLDGELGKSEVRVFSSPYVPALGRTVVEARLPERLERQGYRRVRGRRPERPGEYFWGHEVFWIYRRAHRSGGRRWPAELVGIALERPNGRIVGVRAGEEGEEGEEGGEIPHLEPELLAESLAGDRAPRREVRLGDLPEHVWRPLLAIEDSRFFEHGGIDPRGVARAVVANARAGKVAQGGSTITQQLVKMRDLTPRRTLRRKASEAVRAIALEARYSKGDILESYLNHVYYGQVDGVAIHGVGTASRVFFGRPPRRLDLARAALLAGIIQSPNRLSPARHPEAAKRRRDVVLERMAELEWASRGEVDRAKRQGLGLALASPSTRGSASFLAWVASIARDKAPRRAAAGRGMVLETSLDPWLQTRAEALVREHLETLRARHRRLSGKPLAAALVAVNSADGAVVAYVGGSERGGFDRARQARRQPGSTIKPLVLLEAFERCGARRPLHPASRVADEPLTLDLPSGPWSPANDDGRFAGVIDVRAALAGSRNVPHVRIAQWCGLGSTARRLRRTGLEIPREPPPSLVLGAVETSPLALAHAYTVFATPGVAVTPRPLVRLLRPGGRKLAGSRVRRRRVVSPASAYLVWDLLREAVETGTAAAAEVEGVAVAGKTGTSSERRDAWFAGLADGLVIVVWVGLDDGSPLGLSGSAAAVPLWRSFAAEAAGSFAAGGPGRPRDVVELMIDASTGLLVREWNPRARRALFREGALPRRDRFFRRDEPVPVVR